MGQKAQQSGKNRVFSKNTTGFLLGLAMNNSKQWFDSHRGEYEEYLLGPMRRLVTDLSPTMLDIDPAFETAPEVDRTISRIYRDIRFSKDKSPYRSNMWITFKRREPDWKDSPAFFFEIFADRYRFGMGYYSPSVSTMNAFRKAVIARRGEFAKAIARLEDVFALHGDDYRKRPDPPEDPVLRKWYMKKNFYLSEDRDADRLLFSSGLVEHVAGDLTLLAPLYRFLRGIAGGREA